MAISDAITVADDFLKLSKLDRRPITPLQLMKLVYIAHGFTLALLDEDLFSDQIQAWKYGPVIPRLYHATKQFGRRPVPFDMIGDAPISIHGPAAAIIRQVWEKYGVLSGYALSQLTHADGTPWSQVYDEFRYDVPIGDDLIREHYLELLSDRASRPAAA